VRFPHRPRTFRKYFWTYNGVIVLKYYRFVFRFLRIWNVDINEIFQRPPLHHTNTDMETLEATIRELETEKHFYDYCEVLVPWYCAALTSHISMLILRKKNLPEVTERTLHRFFEKQGPCPNSARTHCTPDSEFMVMQREVIDCMH